MYQEMEIPLMGLTILIQQENKNEARTKTAERQTEIYKKNPAMGFDHQRGDIRFDSNTFIQA